MWLYLLAGALLIIGIIGGVFSAGVFAFVLIPIAALVFLSAAGYAAMGRRAERGAGGSTDAHPSTARPLPHTPQGQSSHVPTSPEALADARRMEQ